MFVMLSNVGETFPQKLGLPWNRLNDFGTFFRAVGTIVPHPRHLVIGVMVASLLVVQLCWVI